MNPKEYVKNVVKTESVDFYSITTRMSENFAIRLDHASDGLCTEAGEFKDALKKFKFYGRDLDVVNLVEELGDLMWYVGIACDVLGISLEEVMEKNIAKLKARYGEKFSEERAENRDLENERNILENAQSLDGCLLESIMEEETEWQKLEREQLEWAQNQERGEALKMNLGVDDGTT